jgi:uncharacterized protein (DUF2249 family)
MVIQPTDRVAAVLARDERLVEVFVAVSPVFERLRNAAMRRVMARLVTVEQAARVAGVDPAELLARLNAAVAAAAGEPVGVTSSATAAPAAVGAAACDADPDGKTPEHQPQMEGDAKEMSSVKQPWPAILGRVPVELILDVDVRDDLRNGREPFQRIMAAVREVPSGGVLRLRAIFEPAPLYAVLANRGFVHWTESFAPDDWRVWFYRSDALEAAAPASAAAVGGDPAPGGAACDGSPEDPDVVVLDVRGLEPPEPMVRTLAALDALPPGKTLVQLNVRAPKHLLPRLEEAGFVYEVREQGEELVRVFIRRAPPA